MLVFVGGNGLAASVKLPKTILTSLQENKISPNAISIVVRPLQNVKQNNKDKLSYRAKVSMSPASVMKLVTTAAILDQLSPNFRWQTQVYTVGKLQNGILDGDLVIVGGGDPKFNYEDLSGLIRRIRANGIREIRGNLVLDRGLFAPMGLVEGFDDDAFRPFMVPPDALLLSLHSVLIHFSPDPVHGVAKTWLEPPLDIPHTGQIPLVEGDCSNWEESIKKTISITGIVLEGSFPTGCVPEETFLSVYPNWISPNVYFGQLFSLLWKEQGGVFSGRVIEQALPGNAKPLLFWEGEPLSHSVELTNKFSNNTMAQQLLLTLAAAKGVPRPIKREDGVKILLDWLDQIGIPSGRVVLHNGSGLSRDERLDADVLADVIEYMWKSPYQSEFIASLPIFGLDGTLAHRKKPVRLFGKAHLKTGSLNGVRSIAGVVQTEKKQWYVVVLLVNDPNSNNASAVQESLLNWVYNN
jgi:D-alanyl-D-alanine carboxypeptidase/D-alanyl-D-alanine-endopeptidase (penicillin-binding protein 4)